MSDFPFFPGQSRELGLFGIEKIEGKPYSDLQFSNERSGTADIDAFFLVSWIGQKEMKRRRLSAWIIGKQS